MREPSDAGTAVGGLILASRSARRMWLLERAGYRFNVRAPLYDDTGEAAALGRDYADGLSVAVELARRKVMSLSEAVPPGSVLLGADTLCLDADERIHGQPEHRDAARAMLQSFRGCEHTVVTGLYIRRVPWGNEASGEAWLGQVEAVADWAIVRWGQVSDEQIEVYLDEGRWSDKAGGYNLAERQQAGWPIEVEGDPTTVMGLPMRRLAGLLGGFGITPDPAREADLEPTS